MQRRTGAGQMQQKPTRFRPALTVRCTTVCSAASLRLVPEPMEPKASSTFRTAAMPMKKATTPGGEATATVAAIEPAVLSTRAVDEAYLQARDLK